MFPSSSGTSLTTNSSNGSASLSNNFPSNFAQTTPGPSFLQQDPFAFAGGLAQQQQLQHQASLQSLRTRTMSAGSNPAAFNVGVNNAPIWGDQGIAGLPHTYPTPFDSGYQTPAGFGGNVAVGSTPRGAGSYQQFPGHATGGPSAQTPLNQGGDADDVIPTAIVVKNIPFTFPSTSLVQIIEELTLAPPYAFNYHYDNGTFRGLAFANFHTPQETDACVAALNGFEIQGRKLRVEYKKVLQAGEKERIERDKAIKRMRSMQLERERLVQQQQQARAQAQQYFNAADLSHAFGNAGNMGGQNNDDYEDYGRAMPAGSSMFQQAPSAPMSAPLSNGNHLYNGSASSSSDFPSSQSNSSRSAGAHELDINDPQTFEIFKSVASFRDDPLRDDLAFSRNLTAVQRRIVHLIAQKLLLEHKSVGQGDERHVVVYKAGPGGSEGAQARALRTRASAHHLLSPDLSGYASNAPNLRKKSMPDLRHQQHYPASLAGNPGITSPYGHALSGFHMPTNGSSSPSNGLTPRHSTYDLRQAGRRTFDTGNMPVPSLPSAPFANSAPSPALPSASSGSSRQSLIFGSNAQQEDDGISKVVGSPVSGNNSGLLRQPRGPDSTSSWARSATQSQQVKAGDSQCKSGIRPKHSVETLTVDYRYIGSPDLACPLRVPDHLLTSACTIPVSWSATTPSRSFYDSNITIAQSLRTTSPYPRYYLTSRDPRHRKASMI